MEMFHDDAPAPPEEIYTTGTHPYCRAPHIYISLPRRFMKNRTVVPDAEAEGLSVVPGQRGSCSDTLLLSRGGNRYERTFLEAFLRPGAERLNWTSRAGTVTAGVLQTAPRELSLYRNEHYGSPSVHLKRFTLRLDGFVLAECRIRRRTSADASADIRRAAHGNQLCHQRRRPCAGRTSGSGRHAHSRLRLGRLSRDHRR